MAMKEDHPKRLCVIEPKDRVPLPRGVRPVDFLGLRVVNDHCPLVRLECIQTAIWFHALRR